MHSPYRPLVVLILFLSLSGCETINKTMSDIRGSSTNGNYHLVGVEGVYTLTNLHPDPNKRLLYSMNYQQVGLLPLCSKVRIDSYNTKQMLFTHLDSGIQYIYRRHGKTPANIFPHHLDKYFGTTCVKGQVAQLGSKDQQGIREGRVLPGMSKQGVIFAIGYPPEHATPSTDVARWTYWTHRFDRFIVYFDANNRVWQIQN